jgi:uncharacterized damage-inducible protein DinB
MVDPRYCQLLARYNRWMNERLYAGAGELSDPARKQDRGAFFGSIHRTLCHLVWADRTWLGRFTGEAYGVAAYGADLYDDFAALVQAREDADAAINEWAERVPSGWLAGTLEYRRAGDGRTARLPAWVAAVHLFNHATHHRGQVTTLLKQAGVDPGVTDLPWMPGVTLVDDDAVG